MPRVQREGGVDYYGERIEMDELTGRDQREFGQFKIEFWYGVDCIGEYYLKQWKAIVNRPNRWITCKDDLLD